MLAILLVAAGLRAHDIGKASLWTDEISSLQFSCGRAAGSFGGKFDAINSPGIDTTGLSDARGWKEVWHSSSTDTHPPLHGVVLRAWRMLFGESDAAARSLSALCSCLAVLALFDAVRSLHGSTAALWAAAIMAVASPQIVNAQEARGYAMVVMLTLAMAAILLRIEKRGVTRTRTITLFFATIAALLTHYAAMPLTLAMSVYALIQFPKRERRDSLLALGGAILLFGIIWGSVFLHQRNAMSANLTWLADDGPGFVRRWLQRLATLPLRLFITPKPSDAESPVSMISAIFYLAPLLLFRDRRFLIWILIAGAGIGAVAASDLIQQRRALDWERYTLVASPALYALLASVPALVSEKRTRWMLYCLPFAFTLGCLLSLEEAYSRYWKADFRAFARDFDRAAAVDGLIITHAGQRDDWKNAILLATLSHYSKNPHHPTLILTRSIKDRPPVREAWFISTQSDLDIANWIIGAHSAGQNTIPFVGTVYRVRFEDQR